MVSEESELLAGSQNSRDDSFQSDTERRGGALGGGEWDPAPRIRGTRFRVVAAPTESGQVRGRSACAKPRGFGTQTRDVKVDLVFGGGNDYKNCYNPMRSYLWH